MLVGCWVYLGMVRLLTKSKFHSYYIFLIIIFCSNILIGQISREVRRTNMKKVRMELECITAEDFDVLWVSQYNKTWGVYLSDIEKIKGRNGRELRRLNAKLDRLRVVCDSIRLSSDTTKIEDISAALLNTIDPSLGKGKPKKYPKPKYPANLSLEIDFNEPSGNNGLDAEEKGSILLNVTNNGMGEAYGVKPTIILKSSIQGLTIDDFTVIDKILPNSTTESQTYISAGRNIRTQDVELEINITEHNGFDLYPPGRLIIQTRELIPPKLVLADVGINDLTNFNGRIEPNEIIEATAIIHNIGQGIAKDVNVAVDYGENVFNGGDSKTSFSLGKMQPNETQKIVFQFFATRKAQDDLPISIRITEHFEKYGTNQNIGLSLNKVIKKASEVIIAARDQESVEITGINTLSVDVEKNIPKTGMENHDGIAVVIGNREYIGDVPDVDFAVRDAQFVKEYLMKTMGYREGNIFYYTNATLSNIIVAFNQLKNAVKPGKSDVFVYYSGHGAPDPESKQGYFVPVDANPNFIKESGYPVDDLYELLDKTNAKSTTVVIDACFSGSSDQGPILKDISPVFIEVDETFLGSKNSAVFTSATGEQVSSWYRDKSHSLFTYYFLKGLQGDADSNSDGKLILSEIKDYIDDKVPYQARRINNREQEPQLMTDDDSRVLIIY